ncbi:DUF6308 family protein [Pseudarthrobacter sp. MDT3-26]|uniref:DUF6308 family protein n=1 Tax=Pseudarthrobacter raffinosi TaxID=2953651 RepID=UPI00208E7276|nr:DUF6308 family protein [Pseudarthrobacter sp. MDT3-26]MCO4261515.1 DUF6308 family protein [Pseudarthrobacter sp. MDT3-26]
MTIPNILDEDHIDAAAKLLRAYYNDLFASEMPRTGSRFDSWAGGGDAAGVANRVVSDDPVAVSLLSVKIPARAAVGILETHGPEITDHLKQLPLNVDLADLTPDEFDKYLGTGSPGMCLWHVLRATTTGRWGIGETKASKIMARKRPQLIPIYDSIVGPLMGLPKNSVGQWKKWHTALIDGTGLTHRLQEIRRLSGISDPISDIRVMDIVLWMYRKETAAS